MNSQFKEGDIVIGVNKWQWANEKPYKIHKVEERGDEFRYYLYDMEEKQIKNICFWYGGDLTLVKTKIKEWKGLI